MDVNLNQLLIFMGCFGAGIVFAKVFLSGISSWSNHEFDSTLTRILLFGMCVLMLIFFHDDVSSQAGVILMAFLGYIGASVKDAFPNANNGKNGEKKDLTKPL